MIKPLSWRLFVSAGVLAASIGSAAAQTYNCSGTVPAGNYNFASLNVPSGQFFCAIGTGVTITLAGSLTIGSGSAISIMSDANVTVNGSLVAAGALSIYVGPPTGAVTILGNVVVIGTTKSGVTGGAGFYNAFIGGNVLIKNSNTLGLDFDNNNVAENVVIQNNETSASPGFGVLIEENTIGGNLVCSGNTPAPMDVGLSNTVGFNKVGQCSGL